jgi:hypothetical protein
MIEIRNNFLTKLGLSGQQDSERAPDRFAEEEEEQFKCHFLQFLDLWKLRFDAKHPTQKTKQIKIDCTTKVLLPKWFENKSKCVDKTFLFKDLEDDMYGTFFQKWNVTFKNEIVEAEVKKAKKEFMAIDEGMTNLVNFYKTGT